MNHLPQLKTRIPGPRSRALARQLPRFESRNVTYISRDWPIFWQRAAGANVWDVDGNRYIDLSAAFGVANVGHSNPRVVAAVKKQAGTLLHAMGDVHPNELKLRLARELVAFTFGRWLAPHHRRPSPARGPSPASSARPNPEPTPNPIPPPSRSASARSPARVLFANSGAEAVEAALKTAVMHTKRTGVIAFHGAYHGLTYGALDATWRADFRAPFQKQLGHFTAHVPYGQIPDIQDLGQYGAVLVEPIQGRGGMIVPPDDFLPRLREFCDRHGLVLIFDEIYSGFGRTGRWFAGEHWQVVPDIVCVGKALTGGLPLSACIARADVMDAWPVSTGESLHTSTFLGHPLGCAAALAALAEMKRLRLDIRAERLGTGLISRLRDLASRTRSIRAVRGKGLMIGLELAGPELAGRLVLQLLQHGVIAIPEGARGEVVGITPPLIIAPRQIDYCLEIIGRLLPAE